MNAHVELFLLEQELWASCFNTSAYVMEYSFQPKGLSDYDLFVVNSYLKNNN